MEEKCENSFVWQTNLNRNTAYPIDYNISSLKKRDKDFKAGFVNRKTWNNSLFNEVFRFVVNPDYSKKESNGTKPGVITIPVELERFFYTYLRTHLQFKSSHDKVFEYEIDEMEEFHKKLCWELYREIAKDTLEDSYLSRFLCADLFWRNTIADALWEKEVSERISRMRELKSHISAENRLELLMNVMSYMDSQIMNMVSLAEEQQSEYIGSFLSVFPLALLQKTRNLPSKDAVTHNACYRVPEIVLEGVNDEIHSLSEAFSALKKDPCNEEIKSATRKAYLDALKENIEPNTFFERCKQFLDYSHPTPAADEDSAMKDIIKKRCAHYFSSIIRGNPYLSGYYAMDQETLELYQNSLQFRRIEDIVCKEYTAFLAKDWSTISMVFSDNYFKLAEAFRINPYGVIHQFMDTDTRVSAGKAFAENVIPSIKQVWPQSIPCVVGDNFNIEDCHMEKTIPKLVEKVDQIYVDWKLIPNSSEKLQSSNVDTLSKWWTAYCKLYHNKATIEDYLEAYLGVQSFLQCLYTIKVDEQAKEICNQTFSKMKHFGNSKGNKES